MKRQVRIIGSLLLAAAMIMSLGVPVFAEETTAVIAEDTVITVSESVSVEEAAAAVAAKAYNEESSVTVSGDVSLSNSDVTGTAVDVIAQDADALVEVSGNVTGQSSTDEEYGADIFAVTTYAVHNGTDASVTVGGDVTVESLSDYTFTVSAVNAATGTSDTTSTIDVAGDVTAIASGYGTWLEAVYAAGGGTETITVGGDVTATATADNCPVWGVEGSSRYGGTLSVEVAGGIEVSGTARTTGVSLKSYGNSDAEVTLTTGDSISVTQSGETFGASGVVIENGGGNITVDVAGDVEVSSENEGTSGIQIEAFDDEIDCHEGETEVLVSGDVISSGVGIYLGNVGDPVSSDVLVEGTIDAEEVGVQLSVDSWEYEEGDQPELALTVWKIELNDEGNVAEWKEEDMPILALPSDGDTGDEDPESGDTSDDSLMTAEEFEQTIMYIIKVEQPTEGGTLTATAADGSSLALSHDYEIAYEGDKVVLKVNVEDGYKLVAAYGDDGKQMALSQDSDGNFYIEVPKGGGVYLSVKLEKEATETVTYTETKTYSDTVALAYSPKTGDSSNIALWSVMMSASLMALAAVLCTAKRRRAGQK